MEAKTIADYCEGVPDDSTATNHDAGAERSPDAVTSTSVDLDAIEADLAAVEAALARLDAGTYWTDEVTGEPLDAHLLERNPLMRRLES